MQALQSISSAVRPWALFPSVQNSMDFVLSNAALTAWLTTGDTLDRDWPAFSVWLRRN